MYVKKEYGNKQLNWIYIKAIKIEEEIKEKMWLLYVRVIFLFSLN